MLLAFYRCRCNIFLVWFSSFDIVVTKHNDNMFNMVTICMSPSFYFISCVIIRFTNSNRQSQISRWIQPHIKVNSMWFSLMFFVDMIQLLHVVGHAVLLQVWRCSLYIDPFFPRWRNSWSYKARINTS